MAPSAIPRTSKLPSLSAVSLNDNDLKSAEGAPGPHVCFRSLNNYS